MSLKKPIAPGAYYKCYNGTIVGPSVPMEDSDLGRWVWEMRGGKWSAYDAEGICFSEEDADRLLHQVHIVHNDPNGLIAELREKQRVAHALRGWQVEVWEQAADLVEEKLMGKT